VCNLSPAEAYGAAYCNCGAGSDAGLYCDLVRFSATLCDVDNRFMLLYINELCAAVRHGAGKWQNVKIGLKNRRHKECKLEVCGAGGGRDLVEV